MLIVDLPNPLLEVFYQFWVSDSFFSIIRDLVEKNGAFVEKEIVSRENPDVSAFLEEFCAWRMLELLVLILENRLGLAFDLDYGKFLNGMNARILLLILESSSNSFLILRSLATRDLRVMRLLK